MQSTHHITLNSKNIPLSEIAGICAGKLQKPDTPDWEEELFSFLNDWFSDAESIVVQTSGSTGEPKTIRLPKSIMLNSARRTIDYFGLQANNRALLSLPCRYIAGKMMVVRAIAGQMNLVQVNPATDFDFLEHESFEFGALVPNQLVKIMDQPSGIEKIQNIRNLLIGGSGISSEIEARISPLANRVALTYGMTETASHIAIRELSGQLKTSLFHCLQGITVGQHPSGCLQIHHPDFSEPFVTTDLAEIITDTSFRILGRADSVIISGGIKYSPEVLEKKLEGILDQKFVISALPDERLGEKLVLVIEGNNLNTSEIHLKIKNILSPYELPKKTLLLEKFPETANGKLLRKEIKALIRERGFEQD